MSTCKLRALWLAVVLILFVIVAGLWLVDVRVRPGPQGLVFCWSAAFWLWLSLIRKPATVWQQRALDIGNGLLLFTALGTCGALLSYFSTRASPFGFADDVLYRADLAIGLDWAAVYRAHAAQPFIVHYITQNLYIAIFDIPIVVVFFLAATGQEHRLREFITAFAIALLMTILISIFVPARTPLLHLINRDLTYVPATGLGFGQVVAELRSGRPMILELHELFGILVFPSFHAASAILFTWAGAKIPYLRWPIGLVCAGMLIVTPMEGAHYFVDVIAGSLVAIASILAVRTRPWGIVRAMSRDNVRALRPISRQTTSLRSFRSEAMSVTQIV